MAWVCSKCTFINSSSQKSICQICLAPSPSLSPSSSSSAASAVARWSCKACTYLNPYGKSNCEICGTRAIISSLSGFEDLNSTSPDDELDASVGSVFLPLQPCKRKKPDSVEIVVAEPCGFRGGKASATTATVLEDCDVGANPSTLTIMSYNVWFREDLEMYNRMKALGDLIRHHSPHLICFQEVTPDSYEIFQKSNWWKAYHCSVSSEIANERAYFCMQLSKLPVKSFSCSPFRNSKMGRELCVTELDIQATNKPLVVATTHLESPCPGPPKWDQMYSKERVDQAKEALDLLKSHPNVIFCGDMNWDDKLDGQFPLPENWVDPWVELRTGENGWTYDTKSNKMLTGNRTLQKRLDRFVCNLQDFKINEIEMIGMEAIPGLVYCKDKKVKNEIRKLELPVLPSDHYGLLLKISSR